MVLCGGQTTLSFAHLLSLIPVGKKSLPALLGCGTLITGNDLHQSVVDRNGKVHGLNNLYVVDGSILPRISRVNPALTIYAWALRTADHLLQRSTS